MVISLTLVSALAGCASPATQTPAAPEAPAASAAPAASVAPAPAAPKEVSLRFLTYDGKRLADGTYVRQEQINAYTAANPHVKIELDIQNENNSLEFLQKLDLLQLSGDTYDVSSISSYRDYADRAAKGFFTPLDDFFAADGIDYDSVYSVPSIVNGVRYGIALNPAIYHVLLNKNMLDEAGLPVPAMDWTWDDYAAYAKALTSGSGADKVYGSYMHTWPEYRRANLWTTKLDNPYLKDDGSSNLDDPNIADWLRFMKKLEDEDKTQIPYGDAKATNMAYRDVFFSGKAAMVLTGSWIYADINDTDKFPRDFAVAFAPFPRWKDSPAGRTEGGCSFSVIGANSQNQEEAYRFITWLSDQEGVDAGLEFSAVKGADNSATINATVANNENLYVIDSLTRIWNDPNLESNIVMKFPEQYSEIDAIFNVETEKFMVGGQDLETTLKNIIEQGAAFAK